MSSAAFQTASMSLKVVFCGAVLKAKRISLSSPAVRAVVCRELGPLDQLVIEDRDPLVPAEGQVVLDVRAAGVNYVDGLFCQGKYQIKPPTPFIPGGEVAGTISAIGPGVTGLSVGDRVLCMTGLGAFA